MSKELAEKFDRDLSASDEAVKRLEELLDRSAEPIVGNYKERVDAELANEFVPAEVDSWDELWCHYKR